MIYKTLHIKLKIEQQETIKYGVNSDECEKLTEDGYQVMTKAHVAFGKVSLKKKI
jgi:hypothetical protein